MAHTDCSSNGRSPVSVPTGRVLDDGWSDPDSVVGPVPVVSGNVTRVARGVTVLFKGRRSVVGGGPSQKGGRTRRLG